MVFQTGEGRGVRFKILEKQFAILFPGFTLSIDFKPYKVASMIVAGFETILKTLATTGGTLSLGNAIKLGEWLSELVLHPRSTAAGG